MYNFTVALIKHTACNKERKRMPNKVQDESEPLLVLELVEVAATMAAGSGLAPARAATKAEDREAEWEEEDAEGDDVESGTTTDAAGEEFVPFAAEEAAAAAAANKRLIPLSMNPSSASVSAPRVAAVAAAAAVPPPPPPPRFLISGVSPMFWIFSLLSSLGSELKKCKKLDLQFSPHLNKAMLNK